MGVTGSWGLFMSFAVEHSDFYRFRFICVSNIYECVRKIYVLYLFLEVKEIKSLC